MVLAVQPGLFPSCQQEMLLKEGLGRHKQHRTLVSRVAQTELKAPGAASYGQCTNQRKNSSA